ncbi:hypothetical protein [Clostridium sp. CF012]|uniref:hypothetical protein n=1 Tax=Clostridium sp. CF012 TaxID=2843319 RepID=UPI001C0D70AF|nr:hypothetical protein [Clostridium sp. CF012]MBU3146678.1 hypothetical protein [Clostridium sp. CF012]
MELKKPLSGAGIGIIIKRSRITAVMTLIMSVLIIFACLAGILNESIYNDVLSSGIITKFLLIGSRSQDIIFIPLAVLLAFLSVLFLRRPGYKLLITIIGLCGNFFYGYALYVMQGQYTTIYLVYLAIFSLSIYSIVLGLLSFPAEFVAKTTVSKCLRRSISIFLYSIVFMLGLIWLIRISPDIARHIPQDIYGVFVLDLGIVFPAVAISATLLIRRKPYGNIFAGVALMKVFTVCLSWGFGELYHRIFGDIQGSYEMLVISGFLTILGLIFFILYIVGLKIEHK